jgi:hypothetical protein
VATTYATKIVVSATDNASGAISKIGKAVTGSLNKMASSVRTLGSGIAKTTQFLGNLNQARLLIASAVGSAAGFIQGIADTGDELGAFSDKTGLSVESIQAWRYAAEQSDVSTEQFNASIERFAVGLAAARQGTGPLAAGLKKLSPALLDQMNKTTDTEEALGLYIAAMEELPDASDRALAAGLAFGKGNKDMALLAVQGSEALKKLREQKLRDGVVSTEQAKKAGELDAQLKRLKSQYDGIKATIGGALLPVLTPMLEKLSKWIESNKALIGQKIEGTIRAIGDAVASVDWESAWNGIKGVWDWLGKVKSFYDDNIAPIIAAFGGWGNTLINLFEIRLVYALGKAAAAAVATGAAATAAAAASAAAAGGAGTATTAVVAAHVGRAATVALGTAATLASLPFVMSGDSTTGDGVNPYDIDNDYSGAIDSASDAELRASYERVGSGAVRAEMERRGTAPTAIAAIDTTAGRQTEEQRRGLIFGKQIAPQENKITVEIKTAPGVEATATVSGPGKATINTGARQVGTGAP